MWYLLKLKKSIFHNSVICLVGIHSTELHQYVQLKVLFMCMSSADSVTSNSLWPHGLQLARLPCPWNSPGKNSGVRCYFLLQGIFPTQGSNLCLCRLPNWHTFFFFFTTSVTVEAKSHLQQHHSCGGGGGLVTKLCPTLATPWIVALHTPLSMGFPRQEYWGGLPFPSPGHLPDPGIEPGSPALQVNSLPTEPPGKQCLLTVEWINSRVEFYAVMRIDKL